LIYKGIEVDFIGSDELKDDEILNKENINFLISVVIKIPIQRCM